MRKVILIILLVFILSITSFAAEPLKPGAFVPSFKLPDLQSKPVILETLLGEKPLILSFFTAWSKSCVEEIKYLRDLSKVYKDKIEVMAVSFDQKASEVQALINQEKIPFPVVLDKKGKYIDDFQILIIPRLFIADKNGTIIKIFDDFDENIQKLLEAELLQLFPKPDNT